VKQDSPFFKEGLQMDYITQKAYAKTLCATYPTILSQMGEPNPDFHGREAEVSAVREALLKKRMRNVVLVGDPGIGKTEIAKKAIWGQTDDIFLNMDLASMLSGCTLVGMFEERFKGIISLIADSNRKNKVKISLFIDEIHNLFRVGKSDQYGTMSGGEMLKPDLSSGDITIIGATTIAEYREYIQKDKALLRRLPPIFVKGSDDESTTAIVKSFCGKALGAKAVARCVELSHTIDYLNNPDCALEIADRTMAKAFSEGRIASVSDVDAVVAMMRI